MPLVCVNGKCYMRKKRKLTKRVAINRMATAERKRYTSVKTRKGPPVHAKDFKFQRKVGNDKRMWKSVRKGGSFRWVPV